jgi:hypothetical protein
MDEYKIDLDLSIVMMDGIAICPIQDTRYGQENVTIVPAL